MTRDEHITRAAELLHGADEKLLSTLEKHYRPSQQDVLESIAHSLLAEALGQKDANQPRPDAWKVIDSRLGGIWSRTVNGDVWLLRKFPEDFQGTRHSAGWWVRSVDYPKGCWVGYDDDPAWERQKYADRFLDGWYGECCKDDPNRTGPGWGPCTCRECLIIRAEATA